MRRIFIIYWFWYILILCVLISGIRLPSILPGLVGIAMFLNFAFIAFMPIHHLIYSKKSHRTDQRFLNACFTSGIIRVCITCFAFYGLTDHKVILAINGFGMFVFILIESKLKQIDKSYFNL